MGTGCVPAASSELPSRWACSLPHRSPPLPPARKHHEERWAWGDARAGEGGKGARGDAGADVGHLRGVGATRPGGHVFHAGSHGNPAQDVFPQMSRQQGRVDPRVASSPHFGGTGGLWGRGDTWTCVGMSCPEAHVLCCPWRGCPGVTGGRCDLFPTWAVLGNCGGSHGGLAGAPQDAAGSPSTSLGCSGPG